MPLREHPEYKAEVKRLEFTKDAIQNTIEVIDKNKQDYKEEIREAFENLDYLDSSQSYVTILTGSKFMDMDEKTRERLSQVKQKPYFGRIDFKNKGSGEAEKIYLGKEPLYRNGDNKPLIVDWRSPIERVKQTTFVDLFFELGKKYKLVNPDEKLVSFIHADQPEANEQNHALLKWISSFKGSLAFKEIIDRYVDDLEENFTPQEDFMLGEYTILSAGEIKKIFIDEYGFFPLYRRKKEVKKVLSNKLKLSRTKILEEIKSDYEKRIENTRASAGDSEQKRQKVVELMDARDAKIEYLQKASKNLVNKYMGKFPGQDLFTYYKHLLTNKEVLAKYAGDVDGDKLAFLRDYAAQLLDQKQLEIEDSAGLLYLKFRLFGFEEELEANNVVIDEAQDFSAFQLYTLKKILNTSRFTILGDLCQGIYSYRGTSNWQDIINRVFDGDCNYKTLNQSYRTTIEIMNLANEVIKNWVPSRDILAQPVIRHGEKPHLVQCNSLTEITAYLKSRVKGLINNGFKSIALICKTLEECKKVKKNFSGEKDLEVEILNGKEEDYHGGIVVLPSYLAKGLEFDAVVVVCFDSRYTGSELDTKLLYISMTRAHHRLYIVQKGNSIPVFNHIQHEYYKNDASGDGN